MSTDKLFEDSAGRLALQADAIGHLAHDAGAFAAAFSAFEARNPDAFRWVLERAELLPRCELIREWLQVKVCVLRWRIDNRNGDLITVFIHCVSRTDVVRITVAELFERIIRMS